MAVGTLGGAALAKPAPAAGQGFGQGAPSGTTGAPNSGVGPTMKDQQTGNFNTNYIDPAKSAVHSVESGPAYDQKVTDAFYNEQKAMLDPQWQQQQAGAESQLANMGLSRGSEAWNREKARLDQSQANAYGSAQRQAILAGGAESSRQLQDQIAAGTFANQAGQADYNNQVTSQTVQNASLSAQQRAAADWQGYKSQERGQDINLKAAETNAAAARANASAGSRDAASELAFRREQFAAQEDQRKFGNIMTLSNAPDSWNSKVTAGVQTPGNPQFSSYNNGTYGNQNSQGTAQLNSAALNQQGQGQADMFNTLGGAFANPAYQGLVKDIYGNLVPAASGMTSARLGIEPQGQE